VADATAKRAQVTWTCESWSDGQVLHAPAGTLLPNAFGLHEMIGNVFEWCLDRYGSYRGPVRAGDGLRLQGDGSSSRTYRGGSFTYPAFRARSAHRNHYDPALISFSLGLRAARAARLRR